MHTENEAKALYCPKMLDIDPMENQTMCIGSTCMAWRWENARWDSEKNEMLKVGYCGLAGKP